MVVSPFLMSVFQFRCNILRWRPKWLPKSLIVPKAFYYKESLYAKYQFLLGVLWQKLVGDEHKMTQSVKSGFKMADGGHFWKLLITENLIQMVYRSMKYHCLCVIDNMELISKICFTTLQLLDPSRSQPSKWLLSPLNLNL